MSGDQHHFVSAIAGDAGRLRALLPDARIVFDWNGTLLDDAERTLVALNATLASRGMASLDDAAFRRTFRLPMQGFLGDLGLPGEEVEPALAHWQRGIEEREAPLSPGAADVLRAFWERGRPAGVISAGFTAGVVRDAQRLGIRDWIAFLRGSVASKAEALREISDPAMPLIYVGDTEYDVAQAIAAGALPIGYAGGYRPADALLGAGAVAVLSDLRSLLGPA